MLKKTLISIVTAFGCLSLMSLSHTSAQADNSFDARLDIETRGINLGEISRTSDPKDFYFMGINTGNAPLVLTYVHPSCNCVRVKYPREPIAPGDTLYIRGSFNPHGLSDGPFRRDIIVRSNASEPKIRLVITGYLIPDSI